MSSRHPVITTAPLLCTMQCSRSVLHLEMRQHNVLQNKLWQCGCCVARRPTYLPQGGFPASTGGVLHTWLPQSITSTVLMYCIMPFLPPKLNTLW